MVCIFVIKIYSNVTILLYFQTWDLISRSCFWIQRRKRQFSGVFAGLTFICFCCLDLYVFPADLTSAICSRCPVCPGRNGIKVWERPRKTIARFDRYFRREKIDKNTISDGCCTVDMYWNTYWLNGPMHCKEGGCILSVLHQNEGGGSPNSSRVLVEYDQSIHQQC